VFDCATTGALTVASLFYIGAGVLFGVTAVALLAY